MKVRAILKQKGGEVVTVGREATLLEASRLLSAHNIGVLLVLDAKGDPVGIFSERDIVRELARRGPQATDLVVDKVMSTEVIIGVPDDDLAYVMGVMTGQRIRHLPIVERGKLAGLVSIGDVVKAHIDESETEIRYLRSYISGTPTG